MSLAVKLAYEFGADIRRKGQSYFAQGRVRIVRGSAVDVEARVRGSRNYEVAVNWENGDLFGWCDCPYADSGNACKHLWAVLLAADGMGWLADAASASSLILENGLYYPDDISEDPEFPPKTRFLAPPPPPAPKPPAWRKHVDEIAGAARSASVEIWPPKRQLVYVVNVPASSSRASLVLSIRSRDRKMDGGWGRFNSASLKRSQIAQLPLAEDREILCSLAGVREHHSWSYYEDDYAPLPAEFSIAHPLASEVVRLAAQTRRCFLQKTPYESDLVPLAWDDRGSWEFGAEMRKDNGKWTVTGVLRRSGERMDAGAPALITRGGLVFTEGEVAPLSGQASFEWIQWLRKNKGIVAPAKDGGELLAAMLGSPVLPPLEVPEELRYEEVTLQPRPILRISPADPRAVDSRRLAGHLSFDYGGTLVRSLDTSRGVYDSGQRRFVRRDPQAERSAAEFLAAAGVAFKAANYGEPRWEIAPSKLPRIVRALVEAGWHIEAEGKVFRRPGAFSLGVSSGVDWFELHGEVDYGETTAKLPALLEALRRGESMVKLDDGSFGVLPEDWLRRFGMLAGMGTADTDHVRFRPNQAGLLDALLAAQPEARCDETFARVRQELRQFQGIAPVEQPAGFVGRLRDYQREGLGWIEFLRRFSFGGCLADDMGVGKTAQVLAALETRRAEREARGEAAPSLVVVPRSLVFNWKDEAARFTPRLRILDYTGLDRDPAKIAAHDLVLTTYGTVRRDALRLKDIEFDYVILDEAQAVKNAAAESSKAVRLLRGKHRLALSGTPIENHLGELWTLFEFLNPGMLGAASVFKLAGNNGRNPDEDTRRLLAHAVRPFILRRTKEQVARELPSKTEQTIFCEMEPVQRKLYNELRQHYRNSLLGRIETEGLAKSKIQVLEALLRLRQAACHPGLIDARRSGEPSAKMDALIEQLREVLSEGHKALVFSQFTSLLALVRKRLDTYGIAYEYLDGATRDRQACVERFQNDPACPLFLISLKAGGLGLNLTSADYVFLLDPWWNPAVEAQAVDRAHRIGQTKQVFAYRLIARDTVEEKVVELQKTKRDLAAAIIGEDNSLIRDLRREDLELLLS